MDKSVGEIAGLVGGIVVGDATVRITGVNGIKQARLGELTFVGGARYLPYLESTKASAALVSPEVTSWRGALIQVADPYRAFVQVLQDGGVGWAARHPRGIHETAVIGRNVVMGENVAVDAQVRIEDDCVIGDNVVLYAGVYVGHSCLIGEQTVVYPHVTIREGVVIGARCILHAGAVLGSDGFGFAPVNGALFKVPQVGNVVLGDDVEIGANSCIDRATFGSTVIGRDTKIDNLVQIGHNVEIGEHCVISGMSGVAGSTIIGDRVTVAAQVGIVDHMEIGDGATIAARAGVATPIKPGQVVSGFPAIDHRADMRILANLRRLPDLARRIRELEQQVQELGKQRNG